MSDQQPIWGGVCAFDPQVWDDDVERGKQLNARKHEAMAAASKAGRDLEHATVTIDSDDAVLVSNASTGAPEFVTPEHATLLGLAGRPMVKVTLTWYAGEPQ